MKNMNLLKLLSLLLLMNIVLYNSTAQKKGRTVMINTSMGKMKVKLYDETPKHRDNFIKLAKEKYFDGLLFHRVINSFMIQGGDPNSRNAEQATALGNGGPGYTIEAEFNTKLIHKKGALAAARTGDNANPQKRSSGSQFYIVQGKKYTDKELNEMEKQVNINAAAKYIKEYISKPENESTKNKFIDLQKKRDNINLNKLIDEILIIVQKEQNIKNFKYSKKQRKIYKSKGGTPFLDTQYTVFGEIIKGIEVIDKVATVEVDNNNRPKVDIKIISVKIIK